MVGGVPIGGGAPVAVQTMTKTETANLQATMDQIRNVAEAGADIVRVAVPRSRVPAVTRVIPSRFDHCGWPRPHRSVTERLSAEIAGLKELDLEGLRKRWRKLFRAAAPPHLPKYLLFRVLAYRIQANALGDLDRAPDPRSRW